MNERPLPDKKLLLQQPWERFSTWLHCVCVVTFDLELGQAIESIYPAHVVLSDSDKTNVCYLAFPDSNSGVMGDSQFHFRIRMSQPQPPSATRSTGCLRMGRGASGVAQIVQEEYNRKCPKSMAVDPNFLFGFAYFRQVKDSSIRRGYYQKSVILLTKLPLITLFSQVCSVMARKFYEHGDGSLLQACHDIDLWPTPVPGLTLDLPLMGHVLQLSLPTASNRSSAESVCESVSLCPGGGNDTSSSGDGSTQSHLFLPAGPTCLESLDLFACLLPVLEHIHLLWELILTAEPVVVMASNPTICSAAVQHLTSIIYPLTFCADYRPFYTIHDCDFKEITASNCNALPSILLGVTNPFFIKALHHWPHVVKLGDLPLCPKSGGGASRSPSYGNSNGGGGQAKQSRSKFKQESKPGVYSQTKPFLDKDKNVIKMILKGVQLRRPNAVQTSLLRRHFLELTQTFMIPLERYLASLMPLAKNISPYRAAPNVRPFNTEDFVRSLELCGPQLTCRLKGDWAGLYKRFIKSANFVGWYNVRHEEMCQKLQLLHLEALAESNIQHWMQNKEEVQLVDMVLRIRNKLTDASNHSLPLPDVVGEQLAKHVDTIVQRLPGDLQAVLLTSSPEQPRTTTSATTAPSASSTSA